MFRTHYLPIRNKDITRMGYRYCLEKRVDSIIVQNVYLHKTDRVATGFVRVLHANH